jgi:probable F420-dependent oxidoreductase
VRFGVHLPQYGRAAGPEAITRCARQAEELGLADVWVSDHLAVPAGATYPPPFLYEPIIALTWAAAATSTVGIGTSVLIATYRRPLHLAKALASLDQLSGGRLVLGVGAGWTEAEFDALEVPYHRRGPLLDETIDALRACWEQRPVNFTSSSIRLVDLQVLPQPTRRVPIWVGGSAPAALARAVTRGDGWHGIGTPDQVTGSLRWLAEHRPGDDYQLSVRTDWDGLTTSHDEVRRQLDEYRALGVDHLIGVPVQRDLDSWLRSVEVLAGLVAAG